MSRLRMWLLLLVALCGGFSLGRFLFLPLSGQGRGEADLAITATIESGTLFEIFINSDFDRTWKVNVEPGRTVRYVFKQVPHTIHALRLDVTDVNATQIRLEAIELLSGEQVFGSVSGADLKSWPTYQLSLVPSDDAGPSYVTTGNDPFLYASDLQLAAAGATKSSWTDWALQNLALLSVAVVSISFFRSPVGPMAVIPCLLLLGASATLGAQVAKRVLALRIGELSARDSIGSAAFTGYYKRPEQVALVATVLLIAILAALLGAMWKRLGQRGARIDAASDDAETRRPLALLPVTLVILLFAITNFPPLADARAGLTAAQLMLRGYDWGNVFTWNFLALYGFLPYRDYWFCYSGDWNQLGSDPAALWRVYLVQLTLFAVLYVSLYEICRRRAMLALLILLPLGYLIGTAVALGTKRYLTSLAVVLAAAAIAHARPRQRAVYGVFGILIGWAFHREPLQLLYAAPGLAFFATYYLFDRSSDTPRGQRVACVGVAATTAVVLISLQVFLLHRHGQLAGFVDFYRHLSALSPAGAVPAALLRWYEPTLKSENLVLLGMHLLVGLGTFYLWRRQTRFLGLVLLSVALVVLAIFFKMLLRPHMAPQMLAPVVIAAGILAAWWSTRFTRMQHLAAAYIFGCLLGSRPTNGDLRSLTADRWSNVRRIVDNAVVLADGLDTPPDVLDRYYSAERFRGLDADTTQLVSFLLDRRLPRFQGRLYVFGDDSYLYAMLKEKPCPFITLYNTADAFSQQAVVDCLDRRRPEVVVWDSSFKSFDGVPNLVRVPILYDYLVAHFAPERGIGRFQILRPRNPGEPLDWDYWRRELGDAVELGTLPSISSLSSLEPCPPGGAAACWEYAMLPAPPPSEGKIDSLQLAIGAMTFSVTYRPLPGKPVAVNLSRLWFWTAASREGQPVVLAPSSSVAASRERRKADPAVLY